mmetsp:Transcript_21539/g.48127  ORF Transcript_21539/g.48127 Transcript_21539/m.48127 type:complete len:251 (+) Transcript_21539:505-1257(+)
MVPAPPPPKPPETTTLSRSPAPLPRGWVRSTTTSSSSIPRAKATPSPPPLPIGSPRQRATARPSVTVPNPSKTTKRAAAPPTTATVRTPRMARLRPAAWNGGICASLLRLPRSMGSIGARAVLLPVVVPGPWTVRSIVLPRLSSSSSSRPSSSSSSRLRSPPPSSRLHPPLPSVRPIRPPSIAIRPPAQAQAQEPVLPQAADASIPTNRGRRAAPPIPTASVSVLVPRTPTKISTAALPTLVCALPRWWG